jgi:hypothetical protein
MITNRQRAGAGTCITHKFMEGERHVKPCCNTLMVEAWVVRHCDRDACMCLEP